MTSLTDKRVAALIEGMRIAPLLKSKFRMTDMNGNTVLELFEPDYHSTRETYDPMTGSWASEADEAGQ